MSEANFDSQYTKNYSSLKKNCTYLYMCDYYVTHLVIGSRYRVTMSIHQNSNMGTNRRHGYGLLLGNGSLIL